MYKWELQYDYNRHKQTSLVELFCLSGFEIDLAINIDISIDIMNVILII